MRHAFDAKWRTYYKLHQAEIYFYRGRYRDWDAVGYETGGLPIAFGNAYPFTLKNSGISSSKQFFPFRPRPGDEEHGVQPDVPLSAPLLADYQGEADPVLAFTLAYIRKAERRERRSGIDMTIGF